MSVKITHGLLRAPIAAGPPVCLLWRPSLVLGRAGAWPGNQNGQWYNNVTIIKELLQWLAALSNGSIPKRAMVSSHPRAAQRMSSSTLARSNEPDCGALTRGSAYNTISHRAKMERVQPRT